MSVKKVAKVVEALAARTSDGSLQWREMQEQSAFQVSFAKTSVVIQRSDSKIHDGGYDFKLSFLNDEGVTVEDVSDDDLNGHLNNSYSTLVSLYDTARSQALGVDKTLDDLLHELDKLYDTPF